jgi:hypothetical protein
MPLAFRSASHGVVAFGFFNIETDLLLLERLFFFADDFCRAATTLRAPAAGADPRTTLDGWSIADRRRFGDLHGSIAGHARWGFLGAAYERWPFPERPEAFRQQPEGWRNRDAATELIARFGEACPIPAAFDATRRRLVLGGYEFEPPEFDRLIAYVDRGGWPRWRGDERPPYVAAMMSALRTAGCEPPPFEPADGPA